jgi:hypothetical protein
LPSGTVDGDVALDETIHMPLDRNQFLIRMNDGGRHNLKMVPVSGSKFPPHPYKRDARFGLRIADRPRRLAVEIRSSPIARGRENAAGTIATEFVTELDSTRRDEIREHFATRKAQTIRDALEQRSTLAGRAATELTKIAALPMC